MRLCLPRGIQGYTQELDAWRPRILSVISSTFSTTR